MVQIRNDQIVDILSGEFQKTNDGSFAWESLISSYIGLPFIRGFWPMTGVGATGQAQDLISNNHLAGTNSPTFEVADGYIPCVQFELANSEYFNAADAADFDILGTETYIGSAFRGLTFGCWYKPESLPAIGGGQLSALVSKYFSGSNNRSYALWIESTTNNNVQAIVSSNGTAATSVEHTVTNVVVDEWRFIVARYKPSTSLDVWLDNAFTRNTTSIPASLFNSNASFRISSHDSTPQNFADGRMSMVFLCAGYLSDAEIRRLYYRTRPLFQSKDIWTV
jgi:hypothetical protein